MVVRSLLAGLIFLCFLYSLPAHAQIKSKGRASFYANSFNGQETANGEIFSQDSMTAAHRTLPFGTLVKVTNISNNKFVIVRINDRGPARKGSDIDLSKAAATKLDFIEEGIIKVRLKIIYLPKEEEVKKADE